MTRKLKKYRLIIVTILLTAVGLLVYANLRSPQQEMSYRIEDTESVEDPHFAKVIGELLGPPLLPGNQIQGLYNGDQIFPAMLSAIASAKKSITFESYIYWSGQIGEQFVNALSERARAGVPVHVHLDWLGSQKIDESYLERMTKSGVQVERYHALRWYNLSRMNNRTHRKILVVDGEVGFTGGVGISDDWSGDGLQPEHWRDSHFEVRGPVVGQMQSAFMDNWLKSRPEVLHSPAYFPVSQPIGESRAQMFKSSSREGGSSVRIMYLMAITAARKSILLESAYFVPDPTTIDELVKA